MTTVDPAALREVFDGAVSLPPQDRGAFLDAACGSNLALRREVERLLGAETQHPSLFNSVLQSEHALDGVFSSRGGRLAAGTRLGSYTVQTLLGAGGMGEVYRASDTKLRRDVAIKILPPSLRRDPNGWPASARGATPRLAQSPAHRRDLRHRGDPATAMRS